MNILIMAGGTGTRLWPVSRKDQPKQLLKLIGDQTLLQNTYARCLDWVKPEQIFIATTGDYAESVAKQLPEILPAHYSIEPCLRARGPAIGLAALIMHGQDPESSFMCMWSDHSITSEPGYFVDLLAKLDRFLTENPQTTITVGVKPEYAHTGLGYIEKGQAKENSSGLPLFELASFKEKPDSKTAEKFLQSGNYLWNSGYFAWKTAALLELYRVHLPEIYEILMQIKPHIGTPNQQKAIDEFYPKMPKLDIEQGLLEKIKDNILTLEGNFKWADIGSWRIVKDTQSGSEENLTEGLTITHDTSGSLLYNYSDKAVLATVGIKDLIIVVTPEAVLVADKNSSEDVKKIIAQLEENEELNKYL
jgi:mannose-1-phosphate guanylyltransferase